MIHKKTNKSIINYLKKWSKYWKKIKHWDKLFTIILILVWLGIILTNFVFKGLYIFEGNLTVSAINFTYSGYLEKTFLSNFSSLKSLDIQGKQEKLLTLEGKFANNNENLTKKLSKIKQLKIEFPYTTSHLIIAPTQTNQASELALEYLEIQPETQVNQLAYKANENELSFCLQSVKSQLSSCYLDEFESKNKPLYPVGKLQLRLGQKPLTLSLAMVNIPQLGIKSDFDSTEEIILQFTPDIDQSLLTLLSPSQIFIDLPITKNNESTPEIEGNLDVKNVQFYQYENPEKVTEKFRISTILKGKVRLGNETMKIQKYQFLSILSKPGILKLYSLQIAQKPLQGLNVLFSGKSTGIATGLYEEFPVQTIDPSWLSQYLSQEAIGAIIGFISAFTGILIPRLFPEPEDKPDSSTK